MALPGLDASVITVFVSRSLPSPILPPSFVIIVVRDEQCLICLKENFERWDLQCLLWFPQDMKHIQI